MPGKNESDAKERLRAAVLPLLRDVSREASARAGRAVARLLASRKVWLDAPEVGLFASLPGEVDTSPILELACQGGKRVLLPRMQSRTRLEFVPVDDFEGLVPGRRAVPEPDPSRAARPPSPDALLLVPGVAFDRRGGRLGRGAGYYDRALADLLRGFVRPRLVGVAFDLQIVERVPMTGLDVFMDAVVCESEWVEDDEER